jgi:hypothetical protein
MIPYMFQLCLCVNNAISTLPLNVIRHDYFLLLIPIQNVRGSHIPETVFSSLGQDTSHSETFMVFFNPSGKITRYNLKLGHGRFLLHSF